MCNPPGSTKKGERFLLLCCQSEPTLLPVRHRETHHHWQGGLLAKLTDSALKLNLYIPWKFLCWFPKPGCCGVRRWGPEEVSRFTWGHDAGPPNGISVLIRVGWNTRASSPSCEEMARRQHPQAWERAPMGSGSASTSDRLSPRSLRNKCALSHPDYSILLWQPEMT